MTVASSSSVYELVRFAREKSPYYRKHYADLPDHVSELSDIPVLDHSSFWAANTGLPPENQVITGPLTDGAVFRTGGTTAVPKASYVTREEFREGAQSWAACLVRAGLQPGDRVANMLYGGDLYKGFLDLALALTDGPTPNFQLSIGVAPLESQAWTLRTYSATVLAAMPTVMCRLADYLIKLDHQIPSVRLILYIGELLHQDQKDLLGRAFPSAQIGPIQYGSVDGGLIGLPEDPPGSTDQNPTCYIVDTSTMIMELITDTGELITAEGVRGNIVITNLVRRLMPVIRYPMGDAAEWTDYSSRKFRLCGRGAVGVRVGPTSYDMESLKQIVAASLIDEKMNGFQVLLRRANRMDEMVFRIACQPQNTQQSSRKVQGEMDKVHEEWAKEVAEGFVNPLVIEWISVQELLYNARSGKLREIVDLRLGEPVTPGDVTSCA